MTKKEYNLNPANLKTAKAVISEINDELKTLENDLKQITKERDVSKQKWQEINDKYQQLLTSQGNPALTDEEIITQAKKLGMKTQEEYQTALTKDAPNQEKDDYAGLYAIGGVAAIILGWT